jgi:hypothetical protein
LLEEKTMRRFAAAMTFVVLLAAPCICHAGTITYSIQNYPADQNGATLSGKITTDGTIRTLATGDILSWSWTITPVGGTPFTLTSSEPNTAAGVSGVVASQSEITMASPPTGSSLLNNLELSVFDGASLEYTRNALGGASNVYLGKTGVFTSIWFTANPSMGVKLRLNRSATE